MPVIFCLYYNLIFYKFKYCLIMYKQDVTENFGNFVFSNFSAFRAPRIHFLDVFPDNFNTNKENVLIFILSGNLTERLEGQHPVQKMKSGPSMIIQDWWT